MHGNPKKLMSEGRIGGQNPREVREGLPDAGVSGNQWRGLFCAPGATFPARETEPFAYSGAAPIFGS
jgi:hypothetical protein